MSAKRATSSVVARRLPLILGVAGVLAMPVGTQAATTVSREPLDFAVASCNGDVVHITATEVVVLGTTIGGAPHENIHTEDLTGVDLTNGTIFHGRVSTTEAGVTAPSGTSVNTFSENIRLVAPGGESLIVTLMFHFTVGADETLRVFFEKSSVSC